ncbi:non-ribosomal peptide synthetase [Sulfidibacter corallicola]|uniref:Amino acid adenylation domain-containing protein n=1 Tax=Sulfidibacter corallicola TaxID=2818388 RepID=A0A8A4TM99_SULCO|nr:non-ribosomal peptide synthetase [Sulfidibacter corallicola]QTD50018.1 amino acid adenylation domain-containing protein [Sulfidibacter corallicola]
MRRHGQATALVTDGDSMDYQTLDREAQRIAGFLRARELPAETVVALFLERGPHLHAALLGTLQVGCAYVALSRELPRGRLVDMLRQSGARVLVCAQPDHAVAESLLWRCPTLSHLLTLPSAVREPIDAGDRPLMNRELWEHVATTARDDIEAGGWIDSFSGNPLPAEVMADYAANVHARLGPLLSPSLRVLEIGCGSGYTLRALAPHVGGYVATDLSEAMLAWNRRQCRERGWHHVRFARMEAAHIDMLREDPFDLVVLNSVIQCFGDYDYLRQVLRLAMAAMGPRGHLFLGDLMDLDLEEPLLAALHAAAIETPSVKTDFSNELFVSRAFLEDLCAETPALVRADFHHKTGTTDSELTRYRFDCLLTVDESRATSHDPCGEPRHKYRWSGSRPDRDPGRATPAIHPDALANLMFTSGSTGRPKAAMITHAGIAGLALATGPQAIVPGDRVLQISSVSFDAFTWETFGAFANGACLVTLPKSELLDADLFAQALRDHRITVVLMVPSLFNPHCERDPTMFAGLRLLILGGEAVSGHHVDLVMRQCPDLLVVNAYGPAENTVIATTCELRGRYANPPIGTAIQGAEALVLGDDGTRKAPGKPGELCLGGSGLARGYRGRPGLTAERFLPHPHRPGARLYRTGDLVRRGRQGDLEFLGRVDDQVKIRGQRVEPAEIARVMSGLAGVQEARVIAIPREERDWALCAYFRSAEALDVQRLRAELVLRLPAAMIPSWFMQVQAFPLTANGKLDKRALPQPSAHFRATRRKEETPSPGLESTLAEIWKTLLPGADPGRFDDFFRLGGHSLKATRLLSRVHAECGTKVPLRAFMSRPTLAALAETIRELSGPQPTPITATSDADHYPLSPGQHRLWLFQQWHPDSPAYHVPGLFRVDGPFDLDAFGAALRYLAQRHEAIRTGILSQGHQPRQFVLDEVPLIPEVVDLRDRPDPETDALRAAEEAAARAFDLDRPPLLRCHIYRLADQAYLVLLNMHHLVCDGWSMGLLIRDLEQGYTEALNGGAPRPETPAEAPQYRDYALWLDRWLRDDAGRAQRDFWLAHLNPLPPQPDLPSDRPRSPRQTHEGRSLLFRLDAATSTRLRRCCREWGISLFSGCLTLLEILLYRYTGQRDLVVGTAVAGRTRIEWEPLVGFFVNTLALRTRIEGRPTFATLAHRIHQTCVAAYDHQLYPFDRLIEDLGVPRDPSRPPLFNVMAIMQNNEGHGWRVPELHIEPIVREEPASLFDWSWHFAETGATLTIKLIYNRALYGPARMARVASHFQNIAQQATSDPTLPISDLVMLTASERADLRRWSKPVGAVPTARTLAELFQHSVSRFPQRPALIEDAGTLTYAELDRAANQLAHCLAARGVVAGTRVAVNRARGRSWLTTMLALFKLGAVYLPLDPSIPLQRRRTMAHTARCAFLIGESLDDDFSIPTPNSRDLASFPTHLPDLRPSRDLTAYIMFTSGSTGEPKGVCLAHGGVVNMAVHSAALFGIEARDRVLQFASSAFDISIAEVFRAFAAGAALVPVPAGLRLNASAFIHFVARHEVTVAVLPPGLIRVLGDQLPASVRILNSGGDTAFPDDAHHHAARRRFINSYGPTEGSVTATCHLVTEEEDSDRDIPIGRPLANVAVHVLDRDQNPLPIGVTGELHLGGDLLAHGYLDDPGRTARSFVPSPFETGARLYATGDFGYWDDRGRLHIVGRRDDQVKVRGFRIELGEVRSALLKLAGVADAAVCCTRDSEGEATLTAFITTRTEAAPSSEIEFGRRLRRQLKDRLPEYMVPTRFQIESGFQRTTSGKIDRAGLVRRADDERRITSPDTWEARLLPHWRDILAKPELDVMDDFFANGGSSLKAMRLLTRLEVHLGLVLPPMALFGAPTVRELAHRLGNPTRHVEEITVFNPTAALPIFCFPPSIGFPSCYRSLAAALPEYRLIGFSFPAAHDDPAACLADLVADIPTEGPRLLLGYSAGAHLAAQVAQRLGGEVAVLLLDPRLEDASVPRTTSEVDHVFASPRLAGWLPPGRTGDQIRETAQAYARYIAEHRIAEVDRDYCHLIEAEDQWTGLPEGRKRHRAAGTHFELLEAPYLAHNAALIRRLCASILGHPEVGERIP